MTEFQCQVCHRSFSTLESCVQDLHSHHSFPKSCVVRGCGRTSTYLARHLKKAHRGLCEYPCGICSRVFVCAYDLKQHSDALHSGRVNDFNANQAVHVITTGKANNCFIFISNLLNYNIWNYHMQYQIQTLF